MSKESSEVQVDEQWSKNNSNDVVEKMSKESSTSGWRKFENIIDTWVEEIFEARGGSFEGNFDQLESKKSSRGRRRRNYRRPAEQVEELFEGRPAIIEGTFDDLVKGE